jgi:integrase
MPGKRRRNGEGTISANEDGTWRGAVTLADGQRKQFRAKTEEEARRKLTRLNRERDQGVLMKSDERLTVAAFLTDWLARSKARVRASTHKRYGEQLAHIIKALGRVRLVKLTPAQIEGVHARLLASGLSGTSVAHINTVLNGAMKDAVRKRILAIYPCEAVTAPRAPTEEIHPLDGEAATAFLLAARGERFEALFILALRTGMRRGELCALKWQDVNMERGTLLVRASLRAMKGGGYEFTPPKTKAGRRTIALKPAVVEALKSHRARQNEERLFLGPAWQENGLVFPSTIGTPQDPQNLSRIAFKRVLDKAGLPRETRFHDLRHTCATLLLSHGTDAKTVSDLLGHSTIAITLNTYGHVLPNMRERAADMMDAILGPSTLAPSLAQGS